MFYNVNGGCEQVKMGLCHNMNDKQCENDHGNKNDSSDVMAKREHEAKTPLTIDDTGIYINSISLETQKYH